MSRLRKWLAGDGTYWIVSRGIRRFMLVALGTVALGVGLGLAFLDQTPQRVESLRVILTLPVPLAAWGGVWIAAGLAAIAGSFVPRTNDRWGLDILGFVFGLWTAAYTWAALSGQEAAWLGATIYGACTGFVLVTANMRRVNPSDDPPHAQRR